MRAMGAGRRLLRQVQRAELLCVGALAGLLASVAVAWAWVWRAACRVRLGTVALGPLVGAAALLALAAVAQLPQTFTSRATTRTCFTGQVGLGVMVTASPKKQSVAAPTNFVATPTLPCALPSQMAS